MKAMLVIEKDSIKHRVVEHLAPQGFVFIHYTNPLKAMDNIDEVAPDIVLFSASDYPRHWKPFLQLYRQADMLPAVEDKKDDTCEGGAESAESAGSANHPFILLKGSSFNDDEAAKAGALGVNAIVKEDFSSPEELSLLEDVLARYAHWDDRRYDRRYSLSWAELDFMFTEPESYKIITGRIEDISKGGLLFRPDDINTTLSLKIGLELPLCTLKINERYFELSAKITHNSGPISLKFMEVPSECGELLDQLFEEQRQSSLKRLLS